MDVQTLPINLLQPWPLNPRQGRTQVDDLVASIKVEGLLQPLVVARNGEGYYVIAGNRRLLALQQIGDQTVPCHVLPRELDEDSLLELALTENRIRLEMHPMDDAEAFARLAGEGKDLPGIARAFSVSERFVRQRLVLAALPLKARELFRKGEMDYQDAVALARLQDPKLVAKALKIGKDWEGNYAGAANQVANRGQQFYVKHARFEPDSTFRTAEDLFEIDSQGEPAGPYFVDRDHALEQQAIWLTGHIGDLQRSGKWAFVSPLPKDGFFAAYRDAHDDDKAGVGLVVWIRSDGAIEERKAVSIKGEKAKAKEKAKAERAKDEPVHVGELSHSFKVDLEACQRICLIIYMAKHAEELAAHLHALVSFRTDDLRDYKNEDVRAMARGMLAPVMKLDTLAAQVALNIHSVLPKDWKKLKEIDLGAIEWPRSFLKRLPRKQLEAEAKALKVAIKGEVTSTQLIERIWKARPKGWVPLYAKL